MVNNARYEQCVVERRCSRNMASGRKLSRLGLVSLSADLPVQGNTRGAGDGETPSSRKACHEQPHNVCLKVF